MINTTVPPTPLPPVPGPPRGIASLPNLNLPLYPTAFEVSRPCERWRTIMPFARPTKLNYSGERRRRRWRRNFKVERRSDRFTAFKYPTSRCAAFPSLFRISLTFLGEVCSPTFRILDFCFCSFSRISAHGLSFFASRYRSLDSLLALGISRLYRL